MYAGLYCLLDNLQTINLSITNRSACQQRTRCVYSSG